MIEGVILGLLAPIILACAIIYEDPSPRQEAFMRRHRIWPP
jgi:hypothetical protein